MSKKQIGKYMILSEGKDVMVMGKGRLIGAAEYETSDDAQEIYSRLSSVTDVKRFLKVQRITTEIEDEYGPY